MKNITFLRNQYNYGQRLQNYALYSLLKEAYNINIEIVEFERGYLGYRDFEAFENETQMKICNLSSVSNTDTIIYGGDQILNIDYLNTNYYDIHNGSRWPNAVKISYSMSDGNFFDHAGEQNDEFIKNLAKFKSISLREKSSMNKLKQHFDRLNLDSSIIDNHIDPIFLLNRNQWINLMKKPNYVDCQFNFEYNYNTDSFEMKTINGKTHYVCRINSEFSKQNNKMPDPREWLWLVFNCDKLITSSFHGFAFGVIFNKTIECSNISDYRIKNLIDLLNIKIENGKIINYEDVINKIEFEKTRSITYLNSILIKGNEYCAYSRNNRDMSTSGGFIAELAKHIYSINGLVYGAAYTHDFKHVSIIETNNIIDYYKHLAGSKYSLSKLPKFKTIQEKLDSKKTILFIGLPCQIQALLKFLNKNYDNLITVELFCAGISNNLKLANIIDKIETTNNSKVISFNMRHEHKSICAYTLENGSFGIIDNLNSYEYFINSCRLQICKKCQLHMGSRKADFTVGDFWDHYNKNRINDIRFRPERGTNLVFVNTNKAKTLFIRISDFIEYKCI